MDYAVAGNNNDKRIDGEHQFNTETNKGNVCGHLDGLLKGSCEHFAAHEVVCGDGVLTADEEECECADRSTSCRSCVKCKVVAGAVCTPDSVNPFHAQCCTAEGQYVKKWRQLEQRGRSTSG